MESVVDCCAEDPIMLESFSVSPPCSSFEEGESEDESSEDVTFKIEANLLFKRSFSMTTTCLSASTSSQQRDDEYSSLESNGDREISERNDAAAVGAPLSDVPSRLDVMMQTGSESSSTTAGRKGHQDDDDDDAGFLSLRITFLLVTLVIMLSDGLQGTIVQRVAYHA